jgi:hypothetical protein
MLYTRDYDTVYIPSMPVAEILIGRGSRTPTLKLTALIDSGVDATIIPVHFLHQIQARKGQPAWLRGTALHRIPIDLYMVSFRLGDFNRSVVRVVGSKEYDEAILGRDVLNQLIVTLNGLASVVEISD